MWSFARGGGGEDEVFDLAIDAEGAIWATGRSGSASYTLGGPTWVGGEQRSVGRALRRDGRRAPRFQGLRQGGDGQACGVALSAEGSVGLGGHSSSLLDLGDGAKTDPSGGYGFFAASLGAPTREGASMALRSLLPSRLSSGAVTSRALPLGLALGLLLGAGSCGSSSTSRIARSVSARPARSPATAGSGSRCDADGLGLSPEACPAEAPLCVGEGSCVACVDDAGCSTGNECAVGRCEAGACLSERLPEGSACEGGVHGARGLRARNCFVR